MEETLKLFDGVFFEERTLFAGPRALRDRLVLSA